MLFLFFFLIISIIPVVWINFIFKQNDKILPNMPFNGYELGDQLIKEYNLKDVRENKLVKPIDIGLLPNEINKISSSKKKKRYTLK